MVKTGILRIDNNTDISELDSGTDSIRLARQVAGDQFGAATDFLVNERALSNNDFIWVTGSNGFSSGVPVIFITDAALASEAVAVLSATEAVSVRAVKAAVKIGLRAAVEAKAASDNQRPASDKKKKAAKGAKKGGAKKTPQS